MWSKPDSKKTTTESTRLTNRLIRGLHNVHLLPGVVTLEFADSGVLPPGVASVSSAQPSAFKS